MIAVPVGTVATDRDSGDVVADLQRAGDRTCVAKGGFHGLGNTRYKSSTNRAPRQTSDGSTGSASSICNSSCASSLTWACWDCPMPASRH